MHHKKSLLFIALPIVVLASLIEALILSRKQKYDWKGFSLSLFDQFTRQLINFVLPLTVAAPIIKIAEAHKLTTLPINTWKAIVFLFFGQEFCYYWYHRSSHRIRWFWTTHLVHHSPNQFNFSAAYRLGWFGRITGTQLYFVPLVWIGFPADIVFATLTFNLLYQFWIHAAWIPKLGWLEYVFNTPSAHRVHHASNTEYLDANYGGVLVVFDRLFGTYVPEQENTPCRYGLVHPQTSYNPVQVELAPWFTLAKDVVGAGCFRNSVQYLLKPPGWRHDGSGETTEELRKKATVT